METECYPCISLNSAVPQLPSHPLPLSFSTPKSVPLPSYCSLPVTPAVQPALVKQEPVSPRSSSSSSSHNSNIEDSGQLNVVDDDEDFEDDNASVSSNGSSSCGSSVNVSQMSNATNVNSVGYVLKQESNNVVITGTGTPVKVSRDFLSKCTIVRFYYDVEICHNCHIRCVGQ